MKNHLLWKSFDTKGSAGKITKTQTIYNSVQPDEQPIEPRKHDLNPRVVEKQKNECNYFVIFLRLIGVIVT